MPYADPEKQKEAKREHARAKYARDKAHREEKKAAFAAYYEEHRTDPAWMAAHSERVMSYYRAAKKVKPKTKKRKR